mmetsp:Transcript_2382/g.4309  ORF Transcript_2382/g.4309 Transcript_2382/m.4309 type:complete len:531 (+) Transcript_2382:153-1745(+)|eukprot:CAMPEP_0182491602 /NCGR_PEP_ID=MMETSP1321-20130603/965_1 /TAXON_ID=91990 /ORGANISM="Bolidomonas sp., Strain RCC1657" /LENGTH=530 /DNA_ID=CAMNT_0024693887 /DNA_START=111 /DNA_END=1703 /DNA_ORIENTATION=-
MPNEVLNLGRGAHAPPGTHDPRVHPVPLEKAPLPPESILRGESRISVMSSNIRNSVKKLSSTFISRQLTKQLAAALRLSNAALVAGACLSVFDLVCDLAMVNEFISSDRPGFATATLATIVVNLVCQLIFVVVQHKKRGWLVVLRECFFVLTFIKPGADVYRVMTHQKHKTNALTDPTTEMIILRSVDLCTECVPGAVIQAMAFVDGQHSSVAVVSLISSLLTAAFISASISVEKDIGSECRLQTPHFYGLVNLKSNRQTAIVCVLLLLQSLCQLTAKSFAFALCSLEGFTTLAWYLSIDMSLAIIIKLVRRDFGYWVPAPESGLPRYLSSLLARIITKIVLDFTSCLVMRHPYEYGGAYYSFTVLSTPLVCVYFGSRYLAFIEDDEVRASLSFVFTSEQVYGGLGALTVVQFASFACLLAVIERKYWATFLGTATATEHAVFMFQNSQHDLRKIQNTFEVHPSLWHQIEQDVRFWLNERLPIWIAESPPWFNDQVKAVVPENLVENKTVLARIRGESVRKVIKERSVKY